MSSDQETKRVDKMNNNADKASLGRCYNEAKDCKATLLALLDWILSSHNIKNSS